MSEPDAPLKKKKTPWIQKVLRRSTPPQLPSSSTSSTIGANLTTQSSTAILTTQYTIPFPVPSIGHADFLENVLERLSEQDRATITRFLPRQTGDIGPALDYALRAARQKRDQCQQRRWTWNVRGRSVSLQDEADKVVLWLDRFTPVGDLAVSANALYAGLPWAGVRMLLEAVVSESREMAALLTGLDLAFYMINRLKAYADFFASLSASLATSNFRDILIVFHVRILAFLAQAITAFEKSTAKRAFEYFMIREDQESFERECDQLGQRAEIEAQNCDRELAKQSLSKVLRELEGLHEIKSSIANVQHTIDLGRLPVAKGAAFDSYEEQHSSMCLQDTRVDLLEAIIKWSQDSDGKTIYWLSGMAGTGKSTVSRTVARTLRDRGCLGASFFFKRGEGDRGNARRFFPTIVAELVQGDSAMARAVAEVLNAKPDISEKSLDQQFERLMLQPLSKARSHITASRATVIVIDALDECDSEYDIRTVLRLLEQIEVSMRLRIFVTSRPEFPIRLGFADMTLGTYHSVVLHEIAETTIEHDISIYFQVQFAQIRNELMMLQPSDPLPLEWPGRRNIEALVQLAVPLFIFATTVCRFVADVDADPVERLEVILRNSSNSSYSKLDLTYGPILGQILLKEDDEEKKQQLLKAFKRVVGPIIELYEPLSANSLSRLLRLTRRNIERTLIRLHSVLSIPNNPDNPIRLLHLSFRDFLVDPKKRRKSSFWIDAKEIHQTLADRCIDLLSQPGVLKRDLCNVMKPGTKRATIESQIIEKYLPSEVSYACRFWVYHLEMGGKKIHRQDKFHAFLEMHFLHWIEALSWLGRYSDGRRVISQLSSCISGHERDREVVDFLRDGSAFVERSASLVHIAPLQLYTSALTFGREMSRFRFTENPKPGSESMMLSDARLQWGLKLRTLKGHSSYVIALALSFDCVLLASASEDKTVVLWSAMNGKQLRKLVGHEQEVRAVTFSLDGKQLASGSWDDTVRIWDVSTGIELKKLEGHRGSVGKVAFSPDGQFLVSASDDKTVRVWNGSTGEVLQTVEGHRDLFITLALSALSTDCLLLAIASWDKTVRLWNVLTGEEKGQLEDFEGRVIAGAISADGCLVAFASNDGLLKVTDISSGKNIRTMACDSSLSSIAFSADGSYLLTDKGRINLGDDALGQFQPVCLEAEGLSLDDGWIRLRNEDFFWLPPKFRGSCVVSSGRLLAIGQVTGEILLFDANK